VFALVKVIFMLAKTKRGRAALRALFVYLNSDEGRRMLGQVRKVATGPEARRVAKQVAAVVKAAAATRPGQWRGRPASAPRSRLATVVASGRRVGANAADRARQRARSARAPR